MGIGMGALDRDRKYVVLFEIYGPATQETGDAFDAAFNAVLAAYGGLIKHTWHAAKSDLDPQAAIMKATGRRHSAGRGKGRSARVRRRRPMPKRESK
jgi:hypothetical protein